MVVGAHAVMAHGFARASSDIDFVVHVPLSEKPRVQDALLGAGYKEIEERRDEWGHRLVVDAEGGLEVETFLTPPNVVYDRKYSRRVIISLRGKEIPEDLVLRKLVNVRLRRGHDFDDAIGVLATQGDAFDHGYVRAHAAFYREGELFEKALDEAQRSQSADGEADRP